MQPGYGQPATGERWNVNMPAVIGVVFVFLIAVVVWVIASAVGDDGGAAEPVASPVPTAAPPGATNEPTTSTSLASVTGTTSPAPMPATTPPTSAPASTTPPSTTPATSPPTTPATTEPPPATAAPATTAPGAEPGTVPGDLGVVGRPMQRPPCAGGFITVLASPIGGQATADGLAAVLDQYPGSNYLRTDETCSSLNPSSGGEPIYVVYFGPFAEATDACTARADGPDGAYARRLSNDVPPDHFVDCS